MRTKYRLKVRNYRIKNGMTQKELAMKIGISQNYLSQLENEKFDIKLSLLCKIANALKVSPFDLIEFT